MALYRYQVKLVDVNSLPILINLDKEQDKRLSVYQQHPYVLLKKKNGGYVVCKRQGDELVCEK